MEYYILLLVSFLGLLLGWVLSRIAWDEVFQYEIFVKGAGYASLAASIAWIGLKGDVIFAGILVAVYIMMYRQGLHRWLYASLPVLMYMGDIAVMASTIFLYGMCYGSLESRALKKGKEVDAMLKLLQDNYWFLVVGVILGLA